MVVVLGVLTAITALFQVLTAMGARRRGQQIATAALSGFFFPLAWTSWYVQDRPHHAPAHES